METPSSRRRMLIKMGVAPPAPSLDTLRAYCYIDDRIPPEGESDGQFKTFTTWVNKAASWIGWTGAKCYDAKDRPCRIGADMMLARDENAFPIRWYWPDRFADPVVPNKADKIAIMRLNEQGQSLADFRDADGIKRYKIQRLQLFFNEDEISIDRENIALTGKGKERQTWWKRAMISADCVNRP